MAKFTMVEDAKAQEAIDMMLDEAVKKLEIKDKAKLFQEETKKVNDAVAEARQKFEDANAAKEAKDKTKLAGKELAEALDAEGNKARDAKIGEINPLVAFSLRLDLALHTLDSKKDKDGNVKEDDFNAFKKSLHAAHYECVQAYKKEGNKSAYEHILNAGKMLIGAIVAIITSPVLLFSQDRRSQLVETFFSGAHSDKSRAAEAALEENVENYVKCGA